MKTPDQPTLKHEIANALSHGLGFIISLVATPLILIKAHDNQPQHILLGVSLYCLTLMTMFASSTLYHSVNNPQVKFALRKFDHISIFFLIGGSYIPFVLMFTDSPTAFWFFVGQWTLIFLGVIKKLFLTGKYRLLSSLVYIIIGCLVFFLPSSFWSKIPSSAVSFLIAGGLLYLIGVIFYQNKRIPYNHFIWHLFVFLAAYSHFLAVYLSF